MPLVPFETLPDSARVWVFGSDRPLSEEATEKLMKAVEGYLDQWKAHGEPLTAAYEWRFGRLLVIGVDQRSAGASGCSIDGLFRVLQGLEPELGGARLVGGGRVFYRDSNGEVQSVERHELKALRVYRRFADRMREELEAEPDDETTAFFEKLQAGAAV